MGETEDDISQEQIDSALNVLGQSPHVLYSKPTGALVIRKLNT